MRPSRCPTRHFNLVVPRLAEYVATRDARYGHVWIQRHNPDAFGIVAHDFSGLGFPVPRLRFDRLQNVQRLALDGATHHVGVSGPFEVELGPRREAFELIVENVDRPSLVLWNLVPVWTWAYDLQARTLTLPAPRGRGGVWYVL
jgi:hypothetical protein